MDFFNLLNWIFYYDIIFKDKGAKEKAKNTFEEIQKKSDDEKKAVEKSHEDEVEPIIGGESYG